jgi:hypothetical protein
MIISDQGSDLRSELFAELVKQMGMRHVFSIADRHANGVERTCKEVLRHIRAIVFDERVRDVADDPTILPIVQYVLNTHISSETGFTPFELTFGSNDTPYSELLSQADPNSSNPFLDRLNASLIAVRAASAAHQQQLNSDRGAIGSPGPVNRFQPGDFVLFDSGPKPSPKLSVRHKGPFEVVSHTRNDVECRNLITGAIVKYSSHDLHPFSPRDDQSAFDAALRDQDQFVVEEVLSYRGDSRYRSRTYFTLKFADGDVVERLWSPDIQCEAWYSFCEARPHLYHLTLESTLAKKFCSEQRKLDITSVQPGDTVYVDIRFFGDDWYESIALPDWQTTLYLLEFRYTHWYHQRSKKKISGKFVLNDQSFGLDTYQVFAWGTRRDPSGPNIIVIDQFLADRHPEILA